MRLRRGRRLTRLPPAGRSPRARSGRRRNPIRSRTHEARRRDACDNPRPRAPPLLPRRTRRRESCGARRTIRVVWFGAEEVGVLGGEDYRKRHAGELHASATESDFGADRIWRVDFALPAEAASVADRVEAALAPLGISRGAGRARGGPDVGALVNGGVPAVTLQQDG